MSNQTIQWNTFFSELPKSIAVAISGGADSFALLHTTQQWAIENGVKVIALTVDHQLRAASADEAKIVAEWCGKNNVEHHILLWKGVKPTSAIQANARNVRRKLLCEKCKELGINHLLLGHQADDQAETILMRLQRGTGLKGLKAMQPITRDKTGIKILRPLLSFRRADLRQYCIDNNLPFIDDPSNENPVYERVRVRNALNLLPQLADGIVKSAKRLNRADKTLHQLAQSWFNDHVQYFETSNIFLPLAELIETLPEIQLRILEIVLQTFGSSRVSLPHLERLCREINQPDFAGITLANCWIKPKIMAKQKGLLFQSAPIRQSRNNMK